MENKNQEDMDMMIVLKSIKNAILWVVNSFIWVFEFSLRNIVTLLSFIGIALGVGITLYNLKKQTYLSTMSVSHIRVDNDYCFLMIAGLNGYAEAEDYKGLATALSIDEKTASQIKEFKYSPLNLNIAQRFADSVSVHIPFKVTVEVNDVSILDTLQKGILNYLESNEFALKTKEIEKENLWKTEVRIRKEIMELDSLKRIVNQSIIPRGTGSGIILGEPIDPVAIYKNAMESYEKLLRVNDRLQLNNSFELMVGFSKNSKPSGLNIIHYIFLSVLIGYFLGFFWLVKKHYYKKNH